MLTEYIEAAMRQAKYEILSDDNTFTDISPGLMVSMPTLRTWKHAAAN